MTFLWPTHLMSSGQPAYLTSSKTRYWLCLSVGKANTNDPVIWSKNRQSNRPADCHHTSFPVSSGTSMWGPSTGLLMQPDTICLAPTYQPELMTKYRERRGNRFVQKRQKCSWITITRLSVCTSHSARIGHQSLQVHGTQRHVYNKNKIKPYKQQLNLKYLIRSKAVFGNET